MMRLSIFCAIVTAVVASAQSLSSSKRGLIYIPSADFPNDDQIWDSSSSDLTWYYNYEASPSSAYINSDLNFVPMLWGAPNSTTNTTFTDTVRALVASGTNITHVLAFNEPDGCLNGGSCISPDVAASTWIRELAPLKELGIQLGGPAVTSAESGFTWLQDFFTACAGACVLDFLPIHYYGPFQGFADHFGRVQATYHNISSIWYTEFGYPNATLYEAQEFYNQTVALLDHAPSIARYSYFGAFRSNVSNIGANATFLTQDGQLTDIGAWYLGEPAEVKDAIPEGPTPTSAAPSTASPSGSVSPSATHAGRAVSLVKFAGWACLVGATAAFVL